MQVITSKEKKTYAYIPYRFCNHNIKRKSALWYNTPPYGPNNTQVYLWKKINGESSQN